MTKPLNALQLATLAAIVANGGSVESGDRVYWTAGQVVKGCSSHTLGALCRRGLATWVRNGGRLVFTLTDAGRVAAEAR